MPPYKDQHYVPKFYFRQFLASGTELIGLFNTKSKKPKMVPHESQCQEDYFYSKDPKVEQEFSKIEGEWKRILAKVIEERTLKNLDEIDDHLLRIFVLFQNGRTLRAKNEAEQAGEVFLKQVIEAHMKYDPAFPKGLDLQDLERIRIKDPAAHWHVLPQFALAAPLIEDLEPLLIINETDTDFIFSDAPVVFYNNWLRKIKKFGTTGFQTPGLQIFSPISPRHYLIYFDAKKYDLKVKTKPIFLFSRSDVQALNDLQYFHCVSNVYYSAEIDGEEVAKRYDTLGSPIHSIKEIVEYGDKKVTEFEESELMITGEENLPYELELKFLQPTQKKFRLIPLMRQPHLYEPYTNMLDQLYAEAEERHANCKNQQDQK